MPSRSAEVLPPQIITLADLSPDVAAGRRIRFATVLRVALLGLLIANLGRIPFFSTGDREVPILASDLTVALALFAGAVIMAGRRSLRLDRVALWALAFAFVGGASALLSVPRYGLAFGELAVSLSYLVRWVFYFGIYVAAINCVDPAEVEPTWRALEWVILAFSAFGLLQAAFLPDFAFKVYPDARRYVDWDPQGHRLVSTFLDPNFAGAFIVIGFLVVLARASVGVRVAGWKFLLLGSALLATASRGSYAAFLAGGCTLLLFRGLSKRVLRIAAAGVLAVTLAAPFLISFLSTYKRFTLSGSAAARFVAWGHAIQVFGDHPVIGIGFNTWGFVQERYGWERLFAATYSLDGGILFIATMTGLVGVCLYLLMLRGVIVRARQTWRRAELPAELRGIALGAAIVVPTTLVQSLFSNSIFLPFLMETAWILWALSFVAGRFEVAE